MERDVERIGAALGRIPSGCSILTINHDGRSTGLLVSWVQQAAFEPPSLTVCIKQGRYVAEWIDHTGRFLLNAIGSDSSKLFKHFGKGFTAEEDAFAGLETEDTPFGPLLVECIAHFGCEVTQRITVGDHYVYAATVAAARGNSDAAPCVHLRKTGQTY